MTHHIRGYDESVFDTSTRNLGRDRFYTREGSLGLLSLWIAYLVVPDRRVLPSSIACRWLV